MLRLTLGEYRARTLVRHRRLTGPAPWTDTFSTTTSARCSTRASARCTRTSTASGPTYNTYETIYKLGALNYPPDAPLCFA